MLQAKDDEAAKLEQFWALNSYVKGSYTEKREGASANRASHSSRTLGRGNSRPNSSLIQRGGGDRNGGRERGMERERELTCHMSGLGWRDPSGARTALRLHSSARPDESSPAFG